MSDPVAYTAVLPVAEQTVLFVSGLRAAERRSRCTRGRRRALGCYRQAVLLLRWLVDGTRLAQLATDNVIGCSTAYRYLHEGIDALAAAAPGLGGALLAARPPPTTLTEGRISGALLSLRKSRTVLEPGGAQASGRRSGLSRQGSWR